MSQIDDPIENAILGTTTDAPLTAPPSDGDAAPTRFTARIYGLIVLLGLLAAMGPLAIDMYLPSFRAIGEDLGVSVASVQRTLASYFVGLAIGQLIYGPATDRWGRKRPLYVGLATFAIASAGCALATSIEALIAMRFLQALGGCAEMVVARAIVRDRFGPRDSVRVFSGLILVMGVAPIVAPLLGGWLVTFFDWQSIFWLLAVVALLVMAIVYTCLPESLPPERRIRETPAGICRVYLALLRDRPFMAYTIMTGLASAALFAYVGGSPMVFMERFDIDERHFGWFFGANAAGLILASQVNGSLVKRGRDPRHILGVALAIASCAGLIMLGTGLADVGGFWAIYAMIFSCMTACGFVFPNATALAMAPHGQHAGNASALLGFIQFALSGLSGVAISTIPGISAVPMAAMIAACMVLALAIHVIAMRSR